MKALIVIDVQNDFVTGALGTKQAVAILPNLKSKIDAGIAAGDEIIFTRDTHGADYADTNEGRHLPVPHCIKGTEGWQVVRPSGIPIGLPCSAAGRSRRSRSSAYVPISALSPTR